MVQRRTRGSNPQPITGQLISNQPASHSLILRLMQIAMFAEPLPCVKSGVLA